MRGRFVASAHTSTWVSRVIPIFMRIWAAALTSVQQETIRTRRRRELAITGGSWTSIRSCRLLCKPCIEALARDLAGIAESNPSLRLGAGSEILGHHGLDAGRREHRHGLRAIRRTGLPVVDIARYVGGHPEPGERRPVGVVTPQVHARDLVIRTQSQLVRQRLGYFPIRIVIGSDRLRLHRTDVHRFDAGI